MPYIYKIINNINDKIYIGKTLLTPKKRFQEHCRDSYKKRCEKRPLYDAMNKYGVENFSYEIVEECSEQVLNEREIYWIEYFDSFKNGYNATKGGDGKFYIDRELVIKTYLENKNQKLTAKLLNIDAGTVSKILKEYNIETLSPGEITAQINGKNVKMLDTKTFKELKVFVNQTEAAKWLIENNYTTAIDTKKISYGIGRVCSGKRKTAYGFSWKWF